ncbi:response regulator [Paenibacillus contaminans]|uniref:Response regulator n=1 Tax=Paenibacillus contaminans TaxID=450362 RepID=A0A329MR03_9BACL|nr:response regulator [Paenibacillus contaminans]RAV22355.1 response regulator [Paenibacillus contaminans]
MHTVMIVDDAAFMRQILRGIFETMDFKVVAEAGNGEDAVKHYGLLRPDLVTMDISMPDMDGFTAAKKMIALDRRANIIMCSAIGRKEMVMHAIAIGAKDFIVKPLIKERLELAVRHLLPVENG